MNKIDFIAQQTGFPSKSIINSTNLLENGASIPFIARYRKEATNGLDELQIATIRDFSKNYDDIMSRKHTIMNSIAEQHKLTADLSEQINKCFDLTILEDIYLPFKKKRKTKADIARENGLEGLAKIIMSQKPNEVSPQAVKFLSKECQSESDVLQGALHIIAEWISEHVKLRSILRSHFEKYGIIATKLIKGKEDEASKYKDYFDFTESVSRIPSHRFLAVYRGSKDGFLRMKVQMDKKKVIQLCERLFVKNNSESAKLVALACKDAYERLLEPSIENELVQKLKNNSDLAAVQIFSKNLKQLLLAPPLGQKRILAIDPGFRTGCKIVCLDETGELLHNVTIFPHAPQKEVSQAKSKLSQLVQAYKIQAIAIGDGTAGRETEQLIKHIRFDREIQVFVVREDGASIYSASSIARKEFPSYDVTVRGAVSIGRRLMDPLAELVKIDPKSIGVGQYQHEVNEKLLADSLADVVNSCVNGVGVDLNTASSYLLSHVSGLGPQLAQNIVEHRKKHGAFLSREALKEVKRMGEKAYEQSAGFLRIKNAVNPLDNSAVHPESYQHVNEIIKKTSLTVEELIGNEVILSTLEKSDFPTIDSFTFNDIISELKKPGLDPRKKAAVLEFDQNVQTIKDLKEGIILPGIINNVTSFGAFVNIGIKENGLIHKSNLAVHFVEDPSDIVHLHQHVKVKVISIDIERKRIGLALIN